MSSLREQWPWNPGFLKLMLWVPSSLGIVAVAGLYPVAGPHALWFLTASVPGLIMRHVFGAVGKKLELLKQDLQDKTVDAYEALMVIGKIQSPGLAVLAGQQLQLIPLAGQPVTLALDEIRFVKQNAMLPGKCLVGKIAFHLTVAGHSRLAFAVPARAGSRWATILADRKQRGNANTIP